jgi:uncharacterized membrane protein YeaQ/YmgE (transglycosylase-associated protein family)
MNLVWFLLIGAIAGWLAGLLVKGKGFGIFGNIGVGIVGAVIGGNLFPWLGFSLGGGFWPAVVTALVGALLLLFVVNLIRKD